MARAVSAEELRALVYGIVKEARELKDAYTTEKDAPVNYAAVFAQSREEYEALLDAAAKFGKIVRDTPTGPLFRIDSLDTVAGNSDY